MHHFNRLFWIPVAGLVAALLWLVWIDGKSAPGGYLFATPDAPTEAGYCLAVAERARELTFGQGDLQLEAFLTENIDFWRLRVEGAAAAGHAALDRDLTAPGVNEGAHLHLALQDCGNRAVALYGHRFASMGG
ncbi:MAG: hypothetical protein E6Q73_03100 [Pseudorhodobacter sp.]|nr:MAG: hypothetical protein E6Q73_03100 [Pseudorhodobacter sp.]